MNITTDRKITVAQVPSLLLIQEMRNHKDIKPHVLSAIQEAGVNPLITEKEKLSNTDWHMGANFDRRYMNYIGSGIREVCDYTEKFFGYGQTLELQNYWYQVYGKDDYHDWHIHPKCMFSNIYYVSLPEGVSKTTFRLRDEEFSIDVKEGDVLTFPASMMHCSKPNQSYEQKVVVVFNI